MKLLTITDLHYHEWQEFSTLKDGINSRLLDIDSVLREATSYATLLNINQLFILGDVFHKRGTISTIAAHVFNNTITDFINKDQKNKVHILVGNHDQAVVSGLYHSLSSFNRERVYVYDSPTYIRLNEDINCLMIPYLHDYNHIQKLIDNDRSADFIFGHFGVKGAALINTDFRDPSGIDLSNINNPNLKGIFLGHYHTPQKLDFDIPTYYVGSPLHHTFNDEGLIKSIMLLDLYPQHYSRIKTTYNKFITITENDVGRLNTTDCFRLRLSNKNLNILEEALKVTNKIKVEYINKEEDIKTSVNTNKLDKIISSFIKSEGIEEKTKIYKLIKRYVKD